MNERSKLFDDFDVSDFAPQAPKAPATPKPEAKKAAEAAGFRSREPKATVVQLPERPAPVAQRRRRTGRNAQLNLKAKPETIAEFTAIADKNGWGLGETLEKAVELLRTVK